ncbi:thiaminase II [Myroides injenensis]|uniref:thiaminase II n=2 Tax=Myroides injenensis TaxID=1183151 RepID=UPI00226F7A71|nr:thiaminase II [Myroides injenensis]
MKWSNQAWKAAEPVYNEILNLPFIKELIQGTLSQEQFEFYIKQDALYLAEYGRILTAIATKLDKPEHAAAFISFAANTMQVERALHQTFVRTLNKLDNAILPSPSCLLYTSYLSRQVALSSIEVTLGAVLPCFWIYKKVGDYILENQTKDNNPYQSWIDTYGGEEFNQSVEMAIKICDELAENSSESTRKKMTQAYIMCSKMEWLFWHSAYKQEQWLI